MAHLNIVGDDIAATRASFEGVRKQLGLVPNLFRVIANSPAGLQGYLGLSGALGRGVLPAALRERIALLIAETNGCDYCLSAHSVMGAGAGLSAAAIEAARTGEAETAQDQAALSLARVVLAQQGRSAEVELAAARSAGWDDAAIVEIVLHVALSLLTNSVNNLAETPIDFPVRHTGR
jgi:AhpD family alkylhydroperoxidase